MHNYPDQFGILLHFPEAMLWHLLHPPWRLEKSGDQTVDCV